MADIFQGIAPPNVTTTGTTQTIAPTQYLDFLSSLGQAGQSALTPNTLQGNIAAGSSLVAPLTSNQTTAFGNAANAAQTYQAPLSQAITTAGNAAQNIGADQINNFLNPYVSDVNKALETNTANNVNTNVLPSLQAFFAGSGNTGSSRALNATGQTLANIQTGLGTQESTNLSNAYNSAVTNALQQQQNLGSIANTQGNLASTGQTAANAAETNLASLGAQEQAQTQAQINAPLSNATNVAALLRGYTIPTATNTTTNGPANSYAASPLSQIAGLGSLFASPSGGTSAFNGIKTALSGLFGGGSNTTDLGGGLTLNADGTISGGTPPSASDQPTNAELEAQWAGLGQTPTDTSSTDLQMNVGG